MENTVQGPYRDIHTIIQGTICRCQLGPQFVEKTHILGRPVRYQTGPKLSNFMDCEQTSLGLPGFPV